MTDHDKKVLSHPDNDLVICPACEGHGCEFCWDKGVVDESVEKKIKELTKEQKQNH